MATALTFSLVVLVAGSVNPGLVVRTSSRGSVPEAEMVQSIKRALYSQRNTNGNMLSYDSGVMSLDSSWQDETLLNM